MPSITILLRNRSSITSVGVKDVRAHRLVPVIPLKVIFTDDPVRMLRAVKYSVSTGCKIPFMLGRSIRKSSSLLEPVSPSRLTEEIIKILNSGHARPIVHEALRYDLYMYLQPAAASLIDGNPAFAKDYEESLGKLDELVASGEDTRLGRKLVFFIESLIKVIVQERIPPSEVYNRVYTECRRFVMPMNPPRIELEFAVRFGLKELGFKRPACRASESDSRVIPIATENATKRRKSPTKRAIPANRKARASREGAGRRRSSPNATSPSN